jgi:hypothetical protein
MQGGARIGAGRPREARLHDETQLRQYLSNAVPGNDTPLSFFLRTFNDPTVPLDIRIRCAAYALPYCHPCERYTKKKDLNEAANELMNSDSRFAVAQHTPPRPAVDINIVT